MRAAPQLNGREQSAHLRIALQRDSRAGHALDRSLAIRSRRTPPASSRRVGGRPDIGEVHQQQILHLHPSERAVEQPQLTHPSLDARSHDKRLRARASLARLLHNAIERAVDEQAHRSRLVGDAQVVPLALLKRFAVA